MITKLNSEKKTIWQLITIKTNGRPKNSKLDVFEEADMTLKIYLKLRVVFADILFVDAQ